ncbi:SET domain-containing protein 9-like [Lineus longissimus]|uniref:SET domain-containing protein 9-like n=1 Tax=Lineus longissimus TaxID=88925 RepID=UPI002B4EB0DB
MLRRAVDRWKQYRYRFVPWIALNLKNRKVRSVQKSDSDQVISDDEATAQLLHFLDALESDESRTPSPAIDDKFNPGLNPCSKCGAIDKQYTGKKEQENDTDDSVGALRYSTITQSNSFSKSLDVRWENAEEMHRKNLSMDHAVVARRNLDIMYDELGFVIEKRKSDIVGGGCGVKVTRGPVPKHRIIALYPGTLYYPSEPIFFQSLGNPFIFRCIDQILIDGNDQGVSKVIYRSCSNRDRIGPYMLCDHTWLTENTINPMAVGQYVNNQTSGRPANVAYQEFDVPHDFPFGLRKYIPNIYYNPSTPDKPHRTTRTVLLVSLRDIEEGEELFSTYYTVVQR